MTDVWPLMKPVREVGRVAAVASQEAREELRTADERLRAMVRDYQEKPRTLDSAIFATFDRATSIEAAITGTFQLLQTRLYAEGSLMRADRDIWDAFREQWDEFADFYRSALTALEAYREVLEAYREVKCKSVLPHRGDLELIRRDKHVHIEERDACLAALREFQGKFSAMLMVLCPVPLP